MVKNRGEIYGKMNGFESIHLSNGMC